MKAICIFIGIFIITLLSCNRVLLARRENVIQNAEGYLMYRNDICIFFPNKNISQNFFGELGKMTGYRIYQGCGIESLKLIADKFYIEMKYLNNKENISISDSIYVTTARIRYLPLNIKRIQDKVTIEFAYSNMTYSFEAYDIFNAEVLTINHAANE